MYEMSISDTGQQAVCRIVNPERKKRKEKKDVSHVTQDYSSFLPRANFRTDTKRRNSDIAQQPFQTDESVIRIQAGQRTLEFAGSVPERRALCMGSAPVWKSALGSLVSLDKSHHVHV